MSEPLRVLVVDDSEDDAKLLVRELRRGGFEPQSRRVETPADLKAALADEVWDVILCDYVMPHLNGAEALRIVQAAEVDIAFIVVSGSIGEDIAVEMVKQGAHDYIMKGNLARLVPAVRREVRDAELRRERRLTEALLEESRRRFHLVAHASPVGIFYTDANGYCLYVNERWCALAGLTPEQAMGRGWAGALHPDDREEVERLWYECAREGRDFDFEYRFRRPDGAEVWLLARAVPERRADGSIGGWVGTVTDITDRKRDEQQMREQLEELRRFERVSVDRELRIQELRAEVAALRAQPGEAARASP